MKLSIVIVNYNVCYFLEQALHSVFKALKNVDGEVFVVDNNSVDNSLEMLAEKFPQVKVIANKDNVGFSRANNQAIRISTGEYVLLLNPDTVVEEDTFEKCIAFMDKTPDAGGLGVKMVNGKGEFLPESKRGIPYPSVAFYKLFGLSKLFPHSKKFGSYHATYLDENEVNQVEVLSGAFMMLRKSVLDKIGLLDEDYFMYGEDIDLSYRVLKGGYKNYYFPETRIIHYKGESTKKGSLNYVHVFYKAMQIFAQKHFSQKNAKLFSVFINFAIWFRASLAVLKRIFDRLWLPLLDAIIIYAGMFMIARYWDSNILAARDSAFPSFYYYIVIPCYILVWLLAVLLCKGYRRPVQLSSLNKGILTGTVVILLVYALLPETLRFSRAVTLFGAMWTVISMNLTRYVLRHLPAGSDFVGSQNTRRILVVGESVEANRVLGLVRMMDAKCSFAGIATLHDGQPKAAPIVGTIEHFSELLSLYRVNEVIFCAKDVTSEQIIDWMSRLQDSQIEFRIAPEDSHFVIGSNSIFTPDSLYTIPVRSLAQRSVRRSKRIFNVLISCLLLLFIWLDIWFVRRKGQFVRNIFAVLADRKSWVSCVHYDRFGEFVRPGVLHPTDTYKGQTFSDDMVMLADDLYFRDYRPRVDLATMWNSFGDLGRS
ncbi:MAG: glycosyltransferase family 2 protein [Bacteroidales bacterium]|nr:glycosyltransferase family 2 protein [Bacteroidales bacterium]